MLPLLPAAAAALGGLYLAGSLRKRRFRRRSHDPRTAVTGRMPAYDARLATTRRMARVNPYGNKRDYAKIEIFVGQNYRATTTWAKSLKEAKQEFLKSHPEIHPSTVRTFYAAQNPRRAPPAVGTAAARVARWRWHHNPIPAGYQSRAGRRIAQEIERGNSIHALGIGRVVARQAGDHVALEAIDQAEAALKSARNQTEGDRILWGVARALGGEPSKRRRRNPGHRRPTPAAVAVWNDPHPHFGGIGPHRYDGGDYCVYCDRPKNWVPGTKPKKNPADHMAAANEIKNQIGARALFMLGAKRLSGGSDTKGRPYLSFSVGRNAKGVNHVIVFLDPNDTYTVQFLAVRGTKTRTVSSQSDVYVDALHRVLEAGTGMATSLGTMQANPRRRNPVHPSDLKRVGNLKPYHFTFHVGKRRVDWVRYGKDMNSTHDLATTAATREYPSASGFLTRAVETNPRRRC